MNKKIKDFLPSENLDFHEENFYSFFRSMFERQEVWYKRFILKKEFPWSNDHVLRDNKFTNVYRELDRASQWMIKNIFLDKTIGNLDFLFRFIIFRYFNEPTTFENENFHIDLPHYDDFDSKKLLDQVNKYRKTEGNPWHTAYTMNPSFFNNFKDTIPEGSSFKDFGYVGYLFPKIHSLIPEIFKKIKTSKTPEEIIDFFRTIPSVGGFQAHEFYIDLCYTRRYRPDFGFKFIQDDFTNVGPGASFGIRLIFPSLAKKDQKKAIYNLRDLSEDVLKEIGDFKYLEWDSKKRQYYVSNNHNLTLHQIEMWLCEYCKYWRMEKKIGKQRSKFIQKTF